MSQDNQAGLIGGGGGAGGQSWVRDRPIHVAVPEARTQKSPAWVEPHEEEAARKVVNEAFKISSKGRDFEFNPCGYMIAVKIYMRPEEIKTIKRDDGTTETLWLAPEISAEDKYRSCVGLVLAMGEQCYQGRRADGTPMYPNGPWVRIGDWATFARNQCIRLDYRGVAMALLTDDSVLGVITDPADITPEHKSYVI